MILDRVKFEEYPYIGEFYETRTVDETVSLLQQEEETVMVFSTACDVQQASILGNAGFKTTSYNVYFPLKEVDQWEEVRDRFEPIIAKRGLFFRAECYGYQVDGVVEGVGFSQLGGCVVQIKDRTE